MTELNPHIQSIAGRRVFVTGHTGFKGSWLAHWLHRLGCEVTGYALAPATAPNMFALSGAERCLARHHLADVRDGARLAEALRAAKPELVIHMAAQPIVRLSYAEPAETWGTNVLGTVNLLEAVRKTDEVRAVVVVTTDKVYEDREWHWGYREIDVLGGHDPYSASKAATELAVQSYRKSFFSDGGPWLATSRGGNVIGGGDWSTDRVIADAARAVAAQESLAIRNPDSTRPWQHVLDCLSGYLTLGGALIERLTGSDSAYNFGPPAADNLRVAALLDKMKKLWPGLAWHVDAAATADAPHEANFLYLDSAKAHRQLGWAGRWPLEAALRATADWYQAVAADEGKAASVTRQQLDEYLA